MVALVGCIIAVVAFVGGAGATIPPPHLLLLLLLHLWSELFVMEFFVIVISAQSNMFLISQSEKHLALTHIYF